MVASGCIGGFGGATERSKIWSEPGLFAALPDDGERAGFRFAVEMPETKIPFHQMALEDAWGPLETYRVDWYVDGCPKCTGESMEVISLVPLHREHPVVLSRIDFQSTEERQRQLFIQFLSNVTTADARTIEGWYNQSAVGGRAGSAEIPGPFRIGPLVESLAASAGPTATPHGPVGGLSVEYGSWSIDLRMRIKTASRSGSGESLTLTTDPADRAEFVRTGPANLSDAEAGSRLNQTFDALELDSPHLTDWEFWHSQWPD